MNDQSSRWVDPTTRVRTPIDDSHLLGQTIGVRPQVSGPLSFVGASCKLHPQLARRIHIARHVAQVHHPGQFEAEFG